MFAHHPLPATGGWTPAPSDLRARIRRARPELSTEHPLFRAAVLLLAAPPARFNIDRLAHATGYPRAFVAACARRLIDNGVWRDGAAHTAAADPAEPAFWNDAAVATGGLCRRVSASGAAEWAPPGTWSKPYDFVGGVRGPGLAIAYQDPAPAQAEPDGPGAVDEAPAEPAPPRVAPLPPRTGRRFDPRPYDDPPAPPRVWLGPAAQVVGAPAAAGELFPGAAWL